MASPRVNRLAEQIKEIVAQMLERRVKDPRLGFVTVTDVSLTGDSRDATVYYTVLGDQADHEGTAAALQSATGLIRGEVGRLLGLRYTPMINFVPDTMPEQARQMDELLDQVRAEDASRQRQPASAEYAGDSDPYRHPEEDESKPQPGEDESH